MPETGYVRGVIYDQVVAFLQAHYRDESEERKQAAAEQALKITCAEHRWEANAYEVVVQHVPGNPQLVVSGRGPPYRVYVKHRDAVSRLADLGM